MLLNWLPKWLRTGHQAAGRKIINRRRPTARLWLEPLEKRCLPSGTAFGFALHFGGTGGAHAQPFALATDSAGNSYIAGRFQGTVNFDGTHSLTSTPASGSSGFSNAFVAKYSPTGTLDWVDQLGSGGNSDTYALGIAVDSSGNVYTTGYTPGGDFSGNNTGINLSPATGFNAAFVSKLSSSGGYVWAKLLGTKVTDPPDIPGYYGSTAQGNAIAVDGSGNVYTTGSYAGTGNFSGTSSQQVLSNGEHNLNFGNAAHTFVSVLDTSGGYVWAGDVLGTADGFNPGAYGTGIALDPSRNIYITGTFGNQATQTTPTVPYYFVMKLNPSRSIVWTDQLGTGASINTAIPPAVPAIAVDGSGNVYTTGKFLGTGSFSGTGTGDAMTAVNNNGSGYNSYVSKLNTNGGFVWARQLGTGAFDTTAGGIALDGSGNVYTTGYFYATGSFSGTGSGNNLSSDNSNDNAYISKLDTNGNFVLAANLGYGGESGGSAISVDGAGNVYSVGGLGGPSFSPSQTGDFSGNADGSQKMTSYGFDGYLSQLKQSVPTTTFVIGFDNQVYVQQFDASGVSSSAYTLTRPGAVKAIEVGHDASNNAELFVIGGDNQVYLQKFDASGNSASAYALVGAGAVGAIAIGHDASNNPELFVIGGDNQVYAHKFDANGNPVGTYFLAAAGAVQSVALGSDGSNNPELFVIGGDNQVYAHSFNATGDAVGAYFLAHVGAVKSIVAGHDGSNNPELFAIGFDSQVYTLKFDATGHAVGTYVLGGGGSVKALQIGYDASHNPEVFAIGEDNQVYGLKFNASGSPAGGYFLVQAGAVKAISLGHYGTGGNPELFAIGADDQLYAKTFDAIGSPLGPYTLTKAGGINAVRTGG